MGFPLVIVKALAADLASKVPALQAIYPEWPEANQLLVYPSATIETQAPQYARCSPYLITQGATVNNKATNTYCVGTYDIPVQLDLWCRYKIERDTLLDQLFNVLQPVAQAGYTLQLAAYFNEYTAFTLQNYKLMEDSESVRQKTWRAMFSLVASCRAVNTTTEFIITQVPVLDQETFDTNQSWGN